MVSIPSTISSPIARLACLIAVAVAACGAPGAGPAGPGPDSHGVLGDTWTRDHAVWRQHQVARPAARYLASLAYDAARANYLLFGGQTTAGTASDTWTFDGTGWTERHPAHAPPARRNAAMAYDPIRKVVVMYGGLIPDQAEGGEGDDTWTWNGSDWTRVGPPDGVPGPREGARMVTTSDGVLLFGGRVSNITYYGDVWKFDGTNWTRVATNTPTGPPGRSSAAVAWDAMHSSLLVFGGVGRNIEGGPGAQGIPLVDTWLLTASGWAAQIPTGPPAESFANAFWDAASNRVTLAFGIACPTPLNTAWTWDGSAWSQAATIPLTPRWGAAAAADDKGNLLVFGGDDEPGC